MIRCDQCDNRVIRGWSFCAYCGYPQTDSGIQTAQREIAARDRLKSNLRHWREECGKLHEDKARIDWLDRTPPDGQRTTAICQMAGEPIRQAIDRQRRASESMFAVCEELRCDDEAAP